MLLEERLKEIEEHHKEIEKKLSDPEILSDNNEFKKIAKTHSDLSKIVHLYHEYRDSNQRLKESKALINDSDPDMVEMAREEIAELEPRIEELEKEIKIQLLPKDPNDEKNTIVEIRAGTGGDEASLFAAELFRMYSRYSEIKGWKIEIISLSEIGLGGIKEIIFSIEGDKVYSRLKYEGGTHRVQRVPQTEASGRIHTSAVTVAVMPEAEDVEIDIKPDDLRIDVYRSMGHGGQSVNTTDSAVRITHLPSGLVVTCQDEKSQLKNKTKAMKVLRARLYDLEQQKKNAAISKERNKMVGSGDRSGRIRTYNYPQSRVTEHRVGLTLYRLESILQGDIDEIIDTLTIEDQAAMLKDA